MLIPVLYAQEKSNYKNYDCFDVYDLARDARTYKGSHSVIAHPPCRLWSKLKAFSTAPESEKLLAFHAYDLVMANGGILEHPHSSSFWNEINPNRKFRVSEKTFFLSIDQEDFGFPTEKKTILLINGITPYQLPDYPFLKQPKVKVRFDRLKKWQRSETTNCLIQFLYQIILKIENNKQNDYKTLCN